MPQTEIVAELRAARAQFLRAIEGLSAEHMHQAGACGYWSVKDVLAHLVSWEAELITALSRLEAYRERSPHIVEIDDIDGWNAEQYHINAPRSLESVQADFHNVHKQLIEVIEALDDHTLDDNRRFAWMEGEPLSYLIAENATWHEEEHAEGISRWRAEQGL